MNITIKATGIELTSALEAYTREKVEMLEKFLVAGAETLAAVEIGKTTQHHRAGDYFRAEINLTCPGCSFRVETTEEDLYAAIDIAKDHLADEIRNAGRKKNSLFRRGGRLLKKILRFGRE